MRRRYGRYRFDSSNEDKILFPDDGPTKGRIIEYYERVAEVLLPHLRHRPLVLRRCPDGIEEDCFYQKQVGAHFPDWIDRVTVDKRSGGEQTLVVASNRATLAYLADQAVISIHPWLSRCDRLDHPDRLVIDLDPPGRDFAGVRRAARRCRELFEGFGVSPYLMTTGSKGLHVTVALDRRVGFDHVRTVARRAVELLASRHPDELTTESRKNKRGDRVYLDVGRNAYAQTAVAPYSLRAKPKAPVATPLDWDELDRAGIDARSWNIDTIFRRLGQRDDPWSGFARRAVSAETLARAFDRLERPED